jgi:hypothetical protein
MYGRGEQARPGRDHPSRTGRPIPLGSGDAPDEQHELPPKGTIRTPPSVGRISYGLPGREGRDKEPPDNKPVEAPSIERGKLERPKHPDGRIETGPKGGVGGVIDESLKETGNALRGYVIEKLLELAADAMYPGFGRVINIAFKIEEVVGDVTALVNPDGGDDVHVPLMNIPPGIEFELSVHLPGRGGAGADGPWVSGFVSASDDGLFGGWAIEREEGQSGADKRLPSNDHDAGRQQAAVIPYPLSNKMPDTKPLQQAVHLRDAAQVMQRRLRTDMTDYGHEPVIVVFDERAGCGLWMIQPVLSDKVAGRSIEIRCDLVTGLTTVLIK